MLSSMTESNGLDWIYVVARSDYPGAEQSTIISWHETCEEAEIAKIRRDSEVGPHYEIVPRRRFQAVEPLTA